MLNLLLESLLQEVPNGNSILSKRIVLRADDDSKAASFSMAFGMASQVSMQNRTVLMVCRKGKFEAMNSGKLPLKVLVGPDMIRHLVGTSTSFSSMNLNKSDQEEWNEAFARKQVPTWTHDELSNVTIKFVETLEDLIKLLSSVHEWKKLSPSLIIFDDLYSYVKRYVREQWRKRRRREGHGATTCHPP